MKKMFPLNKISVQIKNLDLIIPRIPHRTVQNSSSKSKLLSILFPIIRANQFFGNISLNLRLSHSFLSLPTIWAVFLLIIALLITFLYATSAVFQTRKVLEIRRFTEQISLTMSYSVTILYSLITRTYGLILYKRTVHSWKEFSQRIDQIKGSERILNSPQLSAIRGNLRRKAFFLYGVSAGLVVWLVAAFTTTFFPTQKDILAKKWTWESYLILFPVTVGFSLATCTNLAYICWLTAPLKVIGGILTYLKDVVTHIQEVNYTVLILLQDWVDNYRKTVETLQVYRKHYNLSLFLAVTYVSVQTTCETYSVISLVAMKSWYPAVTRMVKFCLHLNALFELASAAEKLRNLQVLMYAELCKVEVLLRGGGCNSEGRKV